MNPMNASQTGIDFPSALTNCYPAYTIACDRGSQPPFLQWPSELAGFEDEQAFDAGSNTIFPTSHVVPSYMGYFGLNASTYFSSTGEGGVPCPSCGVLYNNATLWSINAQTGVLNWHYPVGSLQGYRGQTDVSGNVVYNVLSSGDITMVNAATGALIRDYYIGAPMDQGVTIGASVGGQEYLLVPVGTCSFEAVSTCPGTTPGDIVALTLQNLPPSTASTSTTTVTATSTTTSVSTTTAVSTTTSTASGATVTVTTGANGQTTTVTMSGATTTVTSTSTSSSSNTALYAVAIVAVIFIIATGYLAMRGRKPAS